MKSLVIYFSRPGNDRAVGYIEKGLAVQGSAVRSALAKEQVDRLGGVI